MAGAIATITGTMLTPGVSRNGRLYTAELIAAAAKGMQQRIADPDGLPIVMRTHHDAGDDSARIVGRLTGVTVEEDGSATYKAQLYDTSHGRDIAALVVPSKGQPPALKSVSIHGYWTGPVRRVEYEGQQVTTADGLEIDAVDFTGTPGVLGATISNAAWSRPAGTAESMASRTPISESAEVLVEAVAETAVTEAGLSAKQRRQLAAQGVAMPDGSYPIRKKSELRRAIRAVGRGSGGHDAIRRHIIKRAKALGLAALIPATWKDDGSMAETTTRYSDVREYYPDGPGGAAGFCIDAYNGPTSLTLRSCGLDPAELRVIAAAAMQAAVDALQAIDPDMDGDIDVAGAPNADTDGDQAAAVPGESAPVAEPVAEGTGGLAPVAEARSHQTTPPARAGAAPTIKEKPAMSEPTQETAAPARSLTDADLAALGTVFASALKEALAPTAPAATESAPKPAKAVVTTESVTTAKAERKAAKAGLRESLRADLAKTLAEERTKLRDELRAELLREHGLPPRQGFRVGENDQTGEQPSPDDLYANRAELLLGAFGRTPQPAQ
ncbi:hypothetical protein LN042_11340 [Kitasatospora sp. RB6PN24]|uniref:hypothetical protein n=1 Tax=Kitasatospora humi TaxID=2893891 RepID=UPI001E53D617|nr:hypothetical protein [Kitasatospora humi]MCC9307689.1 hypothetical protein [Kitasatospora humi]